MLRKYIVILLFFNFNLFADSNSTAILKKLVELTKSDTKLENYAIFSIQNELNREHYENKYLKLNNLILDVDTENKVLKKELEQQKEFFIKILETQTNQYQIELEQQTLIYNIAFGGLTIIAFILSWFGYTRLKKYTNKIVKAEHSNAIKEVSDNISKDKALQTRIESLVRIEIEKHTPTVFEGGVK